MISLQFERALSLPFASPKAMVSDLPSRRKSWEQLYLAQARQKGAGLFIEPLAFWVALGLALLMIGAVGNHLKVKHPITQSVPASVLLILSLLLIVLR